MRTDHIRYWALGTLPGLALAATSVQMLYGPLRWVFGAFGLLMGLLPVALGVGEAV